jgi:hypothetical protein
MKSFIDSSTATTWPASTLSPSATWSETTVPGIVARIVSPARRSRRAVASAATAANATRPPLEPQWRRNSLAVAHRMDRARVFAPSIVDGREDLGRCFAITMSCSAAGADHADEAGMGLDAQLPRCHWHRLIER